MASLSPAPRAMPARRRYYAPADFKLIKSEELRIPANRIEIPASQTCTAAGSSHLEVLIDFLAVTTGGPAPIELAQALQGQVSNPPPQRGTRSDGGG